MKIKKLKNYITNYFQSSDNLKQLAHFSLLGFWGLSQFFLGNKYFVIFIVFFLLTLIISRPLPSRIVTLLFLVIVFFATPAIDTLMEVKQSDLNTINDPGGALSNILSPDTGREVLPSQVQQMLKLLHRNNISNYQLSNQYEEGLGIQRIIEGIWPIKIEPISSYFIISHNEIDDFSSCERIDETKDVVLVYCN
ncbi:MAG: hypothetical protein FVQ83_03585 [Chloroflexi bacterium]|nr:hypothetical protein [Chloroflexota bacterium]